MVNGINIHPKNPLLMKAHAITTGSEAPAETEKSEGNTTSIPSAQAYQKDKCSSDDKIFSNPNTRETGAVGPRSNITRAKTIPEYRCNAFLLLQKKQPDQAMIYVRMLYPQFKTFAQHRRHTLELVLAGYPGFTQEVIAHFEPCYLMFEKHNPAAARAYLNAAYRKGTRTRKGVAMQLPLLREIYPPELKKAKSNWNRRQKKLKADKEDMSRDGSSANEEVHSMEDIISNENTTSQEDTASMEVVSSEKNTPSDEDSKFHKDSPGIDEMDFAEWMQDDLERLGIGG